MGCPPIPYPHIPGFTPQQNNYLARNFHHLEQVGCVGGGAMGCLPNGKAIHGDFGATYPLNDTAYPTWTWAVNGDGGIQIIGEASTADSIAVVADGWYAINYTVYVERATVGDTITGAQLDLQIVSSGDSANNQVLLGGGPVWNQTVNESHTWVGQLCAGSVFRFPVYAEGVGDFDFTANAWVWQLAAQEVCIDCEGGGDG